MAYTGPFPLPVPDGGTGDSSFTAYSVIAGGTTSTGALQNVSGVGTSGQVLTSNGSAALPTWQAASAGSGGAKAWGLINIDGSQNYTLTVGFNVTSVTGSGTGTVTLTSGFSSSNYVVVASGSLTSQNDVVSVQITNSTTFTISGGSSLSAKLYFACFGT